MLRPEKTLALISDDLIAYLEADLDNAAIGYDTPLTQMEGGYETYTFCFKLSGVRGELSKPLILRLYPPLYGPDRAIWESTLQNALADAGYPAPRVYLTCTDTSILGSPFLIMAFLAGETMLTACAESLPELLGRTHAALHRIDPEPLVWSLKARGFEDHRYRFDGWLDWLNDTAKRYSWLREGVNWLWENRPPEPERLSTCHGDFHPLNILVQDGRVTGVLDWPGLIIADPALDVACTTVLLTIHAKHHLHQVEWPRVAEMYLDAYQAERALDPKHLEYYQVWRCICAFEDGADGLESWQHPLVVRDLAEQVHRTTGIRITPQSQT